MLCLHSACAELVHKPPSCGCPRHAFHCALYIKATFSGSVAPGNAEMEVTELSCQNLMLGK